MTSALITQAREAVEGVTLEKSEPIISLMVSECCSGKATKRSLAVIYALLIARGHAHKSGEFWPPIHLAMAAALAPDAPFIEQMRKLDPVKKMAWDIFEASARRRAALKDATP